MPPKIVDTKIQYPVQEPGAEVLCPITQPDGTRCRKRCLGEKRFRSIQEHIRRAHPEYYLPRLPATKESFDLMVNTPPHEVPPKPEKEEPWSTPSDQSEQFFKHPSGTRRPNGQTPTKQYYIDDMSLDHVRASGPFRRESHSAAAALASLSYTRPDGNWQEGPAFYTERRIDDEDDDRPMPDPTLSADQRLLDSRFSSESNGSPSARNRFYAPAVQRVHPRSAGHSRRSSPKRSKYDRMMAKDLLRPNYDRKTGSAEPSAAAAALLGKRWEDLIDAATSVADQDSREHTPLPASPFRSPPAHARASPTPNPGSRTQTRAASPLQRRLSPQVQVVSDNLEVQSYMSTGEDFILDPPKGGPQQNAMYAALAPSHMTVSSNSDSSTVNGSNHNVARPFSSSGSGPVQIYCAGCRTVSVLADSFACTECICGLCRGCVDALVSEKARGRHAAQCPRCGTSEGRFKLFQLDLRS